MRDARFRFPRSECLPLAVFAQTEATYSILERGQDYAVYGRVQTITNADGGTYTLTNKFTLLENALHYLDHSDWKESQDVIEPFPDGAVARYGPHQAIFSADLNAEAVFDIQAADGKRIRGGIRAIQLTDLASGQAITLGTVKESVKGQLLPPNRIVYENAFDGIRGDLLLVWKHNLFSHDVVLLEQPELPVAWDPANVRLEVVTEFLVDEQPELRTQVGQGEGQLDDDVVIDFGSLAMVMGKAFRATDELALGGLNDEGVPVLKQWQRTEDGRSYLVESVGWPDVQPMLEDLPVPQLAALPSAAGFQSQVASRESKIPSPMQLAAVDCEPWGCVLDFVIIPDEGTPTTLVAGNTYYIKTSYYSGSSVTFEPGCTIKFKNNAYMLLYGPMSFPDTLQTPVFTSRNDDGFGVFEQTGTGVYANLQNATLTLSGVKKRTVPITVSVVSGTVNGSMSEAKFYTDKSFEGITGVFTNAPGVIVPDPMGAVGLEHFVEHLNGKIAVFSKATGLRIADAEPQLFFQLAGEARDLFDPRIAYDHGSSRWVACVVDKISKNVLLAVSKSSSPVPLDSSNWYKYELTVARSGSLSDFPTLGLDANGLYVAVFHYHFVGEVLVKDGNTVVAIRKPGVYQGNLQATYLFNTTSEIDTWAIQPAVNYDSSPLGGYAWFVAKGPSQGSPNPYQAGRLKSRKLAWETNGAEWKSSWVELSSPASYVAYFDLDRGSVTAPQLGTSSEVDLHRTGSRLMMALIKFGSLWTCQHVGLDGTDGDYDGGDTGTSVDRSAIQWIRLQLSASGPPVYSIHGRIYSSAASNPYWYYMPSLAINNAAHMVCGFSGSRETEYIGAFWYGRLANGSVPEPITIVQSGRNPAATADTSARWGDYSHTTLDPNGTTFWTVQEYAGYDQVEGPIWSTWISSVGVAP